MPDAADTFLSCRLRRLAQLTAPAEGEVRANLLPVLAAWDRAVDEAVEEMFPECRRSDDSATVHSVITPVRMRQESHQTIGCLPRPAGGSDANALRALRSFSRPGLVRGKRAWWQYTIPT